MEMIKSTTKVVCDAGPVIHLGEIESLHLLNDFKAVLLTNQLPIKSSLYIKASLLEDAISSVKQQFNL